MSAWVSAHLFCAERQNALLLEGVAPLVTELRGGGALERWFFIRHLDEGPHVRLRLRAHDGAAVARRAIEALRPWCEAIDLRAYEPEVARYGGALGIEIAEEHFQDSSEVALAVLEERGDANKVRGAALQLMLAAAAIFAAGDELRDEFLLRYARGAIRAHGGDEAVLRESEARLDAEAARNADAVAPVAVRIAEAIDARHELDGATLARWCAALRRLRARLEAADAAGDLDIGPTFDARWSAAAPPAVLRLLVLLPSFVHMMNNRLAVAPVVEAQLARFLLAAREVARA